MLSPGNFAEMDVYVRRIKSEKTSNDDRMEAYQLLRRYLQDDKDIPQNFLPEASNVLSSLKQDMNSDVLQLAQESLHFLGVFLHSEKIVKSIDETKLRNVVDDLCTLISTSKEKPFCTRGFWCLARQKLPLSICVDKLGKILDAVKDTVQDPKQMSQSLELEVIRVLNRLLNDMPDGMEKHILSWSERLYLATVHPVLKVREAALVVLILACPCLVKGHLDVLPKLVPELKKTLVPGMLKLFKGKHEIFALKLWNLMLDILGQTLHQGATLINHLLAVVEKAFKSPSYDIKIEAFKSWQHLIKNFGTAMEVLSNPKRLRLLMQPFRTNNARTEQVALVKFKVWWFLITSLGPELSSNLETVLFPFFQFAFGLSDDTLNQSFQSSTPTTESINKLNLTRSSILTPPAVSPGQMCDINHRQGCEALSQVLGYGLTIPVSKPPLTIGVITHPVIVPPNVFVRHAKTLINFVKSAIIGLGSEKKNLHLQLYLWQCVVNHLTKNWEEDNKKEISDAMTSFFASLDEFRKSDSLHADVVLKLVEVSMCLPQKVLNSSAYIVGNSSVMNETPALFLIRLIFQSPILSLVNSNETRYIEIFKNLVSKGLTPTLTVLSFVQSVLGLLTSVANEIDDCERLFGLWCILANPLLERVERIQEINQGDSFEHDFSCMYDVLLFPVKHLFMKPLYQSGTMIRMWTDLCRLLSRCAALVTNADANVWCEELCSKLLSYISEGKSKESNVTHLQSNTLMQQSLSEILSAIVSVVDFSSHRTESFDKSILSSPSNWLKRKQKPLGNFTALSLLLDKIIHAICEAGISSADGSSGETNETSSYSHTGLVTIIDVTHTFFIKMKTAALIGPLISKLAVPISRLFILASEEHMEKAQLQRITLKLETLWHTIINRIQVIYPGPYDSEFLKALSPVMEATLASISVPIQNKTRVLWQSSFSFTTQKLELPASLTLMLEKLWPSLVPGLCKDNTVNTSNEVLLQALESADQLPVSVEPITSATKLGSPSVWFRKSNRCEMNKTTKEAEKNKGSHSETLKKRIATDLNDDEFVRILPDPKRRRILTPRQKEVLTQKSILPAMYADLSQDSVPFVLPPQFVETESQLSLPLNENIVSTEPDVSNNVPITEPDVSNSVPFTEPDVSNNVSITEPDVSNNVPITVSDEQSDVIHNDEAGAQIDDDLNSLDVDNSDVSVESIEIIAEIPVEQVKLDSTISLSTQESVAASETSPELIIPKRIEYECGDDKLKADPVLTLKRLSSHEIKLLSNSGTEKTSAEVKSSGKDVGAEGGVGSETDCSLEEQSSVTTTHKSTTMPVSKNGIETPVCLFPEEPCKSSDDKNEDVIPSSQSCESVGPQRSGIGSSLRFQRTNRSVEHKSDESKISDSEALLQEMGESASEPTSQPLNESAQTVSLSKPKGRFRKRTSTTVTQQEHNSDATNDDNESSNSDQMDSVSKKENVPSLIRLRARSSKKISEVFVEEKKSDVNLNDSSDSSTSEPKNTVLDQESSVLTSSITLRARPRRKVSVIPLQQDSNDVILIDTGDSSSGLASEEIVPPSKHRGRTKKNANAMEQVSGETGTADNVEPTSLESVSMVTRSGKIVFKSVIPGSQEALPSTLDVANTQTSNDSVTAVASSEDSAASAVCIQGQEQLASYESSAETSDSKNSSASVTELNTTPVSPRPRKAKTARKSFNPVMSIMESAVTSQDLEEDSLKYRLFRKSVETPSIGPKLRSRRSIRRSVQVPVKSSSESVGSPENFGVECMEVDAKIRCSPSVAELVKSPILNAVTWEDQSEESSTTASNNCTKIGGLADEAVEEKLETEDEMKSPVSTADSESTKLLGIGKRVLKRTCLGYVMGEEERLGKPSSKPQSDLKSNKSEISPAEIVTVDADDSEEEIDEFEGTFDEPPCRSIVGSVGKPVDLFTSLEIDSPTVSTEVSVTSRDGALEETTARRGERVFFATPTRELRYGKRFRLMKSNEEGSISFIAQKNPKTYSRSSPVKENNNQPSLLKTSPLMQQRMNSRAMRMVEAGAKNYLSSQEKLKYETKRSSEADSNGHLKANDSANQKALLMLKSANGTQAGSPGILKRRQLRADGTVEVPPSQNKRRVSFADPLVELENSKSHSKIKNRCLRMSGDLQNEGVNNEARTLAEPTPNDDATDRLQMVVTAAISDNILNEITVHMLHETATTCCPTRDSIAVSRLNEVKKESTHVVPSIDTAEPTITEKEPAITIPSLEITPAPAQPVSTDKTIIEELASQDEMVKENVEVIKIPDSTIDEMETDNMVKENVEVINIPDTTIEEMETEQIVPSTESIPAIPEFTVETSDEVVIVGANAEIASDETEESKSLVLTESVAVSNEGELQQDKSVAEEESKSPNCATVLSEVPELGMEVLIPSSESPVEYRSPGEKEPSGSELEVVVIEEPPAKKPLLADGKDLIKETNELMSKYTMNTLHQLSPAETLHLQSLLCKMTIAVTTASVTSERHRTGQR